MNLRKLKGMLILVLVTGVCFLEGPSWAADNQKSVNADEEWYTHFFKSSEEKPVSVPTASATVEKKEDPLARDSKEEKEDSLEKRVKEAQRLEKVKEVQVYGQAQAAAQKEEAAQAQKASRQAQAVSAARAQQVVSVTRSVG